MNVECLKSFVEKSEISSALAYWEHKIQTAGNQTDVDQTTIEQKTTIEQTVNQTAANHIVQQTADQMVYQTESEQNVEKEMCCCVIS